jgi:hypothetical protein
VTPDHIREAALKAYDRVGPLSLGPAIGQPGDLSVACASPKESKADSVCRLVAVLGSDDSTKTAIIQLATNEIEQSTDLDLILGPGEVGPFAVAIQSELYGPLFIDQLRGSVGQLSSEHLDAIARALLTDGESLEGFPTGTPLGGPDDPRRAFKHEELANLEHLIAECRTWLDGEASPDTVLDPMLFVPPPSGTATEIAEDRFLELLDAVNPLGPGPIMLPSEFMASSEFFLNELLRWRKDFGLDASRILARIQITELGTELTDASTAPNEEFTTDDSSAVLMSYLSDCARVGKATVDIHSVRRCWGDRGLLIVAQKESRYCRGRAMIMEAA